MLVDHHVARFDVPGEPDQWLDLRPLSFTEQHELRRRSSAAFLADLAGMPQAVIEAQVRLEAEAKDRRREEAARRAAAGEPPLPDPALPDPDLIDGQDLATVLEHGIVAWSYAEEGDEEVAVNEDTVQMLDDDTARWAAREILRMTWPERAASIDAEVEGGPQTPPAADLDSSA